MAYSYIIELGNPDRYEQCLVYVIPYKSKQGIERGKKESKISVKNADTGEKYRIKASNFDKDLKGGWVIGGKKGDARSWDINQAILDTIKEHKKSGSKTDYTFTDAFKLYCNQYDPEKNEGHLMSTSSSYNSFLNYAGNIMVADISKTVITNYITDCKKDKKDSTIRTYLDKVKAIVLLVDENNKAFNEPRKRLKTVKPKRPYLVAEQIRKIELHESKQTTKPHRDMWLFSYYNRGIRGRDVILYKGPNFTTSKNKAQINLHLSEKSLKIIERWQGKDPDGYIFPVLNGQKPTVKATSAILSRVWDTMNSIAKKEGIKLKIGMHTARHSFANAAKKKLDLMTIRDLLTHSDAGQTQEYIDSLSHDELQEATKSLEL